jgi:DNA ligase-associated metallophosphoesterase
MRVPIAGAPWQFLPQRAALHEDERMLVVADVHFGKAAAFRARGVPVPRGTTTENLLRLTALIRQTRPRMLVVLGDLFHAREALAPTTVDAVRAWRARHAAVELVLVEGNHDRSTGALPDELGVTVVDEPWRIGRLAFCHHPQIVAGATVFAGHLHPCVQLSGRADDTLRVPCFWLRSDVVILPAFGEFTGGAPIARDDGDRVIAVADGRLFEIPAARARIA